MEENKKVLSAVIGFFILIAVVIAVYYLFIREKGEEMPKVPEVVEETVIPVESEEPEEELIKPIKVIEVELDESDKLMRKLAADLSSRPELAEWLLTKDIIRKFVAAVDNIANGQSPRKNIDFFNPGKFFPLKKEGVYYLDPAGFKRYSPVANVFSSLDSEGCIRLYRQLKPALQEAYQDLGYPDKDFNVTLFQAMDELMKVPVIEEDIALEEKLTSYVMVDPELEKLSEAQKHLFRMGPVNIRKIKAKLKDLESVLKKD
jgi:hypothetical protein